MPRFLSPPFFIHSLLIIISFVSIQFNSLSFSPHSHKKEKLFSFFPSFIPQINLYLPSSSSSLSLSRATDTFAPRRSIPSRSGRRRKISTVNFVLCSRRLPSVCSISLMESTDSSSSSRQPHLPPGFRFHPTDEELVVHYLKKKAASAPLPVTIIADVDLYKFDPWELPGQATFGEQEWYFFSPRDRKYPNGARPNRAATSGYWKATGTDKPILTAAGNQKVGVKKALVFYGGRPPKGVKTNWIMHEYRLVDTAAAASNNSTDHHISTAKKASLRLDDWVLCRIYQKNNPNRPTERDKGVCDHVEEMIAGSLLNPSCPKQQLLVQKPGYGSVLDNGAGAAGDESFFQGLLASEEGNIIQVGAGTAAASSSSSVGSKSDLSAVPLHAGLRQHPPKRYWHSGDAAGGVKRLNTNGSCDNSVGGANSFPTTSLLNQVLPQPGPPFHHSFIGNVVGEGIFRQPYPLSGINWGS